jgi:hypothetical protein
MWRVTTDPGLPPQPPQTGLPEIDEALAALDLDGDVSGHHRQLAAALDVLARALNTPAGPARQ